LDVIKGAVRELDRKDVFICHATNDKSRFVNPLVGSLKAKNVSFWVDEAEIHWGDSITDKISEGLLRARYVMVLLTAAFLRRKWPAMKMKAALTREAESNDPIVLP